MESNCNYLFEILSNLESGISACNNRQEMIDIFMNSMKYFKENNKIIEYSLDKCEIEDAHKILTFIYTPNSEQYIKSGEKQKCFIVMNSEKKDDISISNILNEINYELSLNNEEKNKVYDNLVKKIDDILEEME